MKIALSCELPFPQFLVKTQHREIWLQLLVLEIMSIFQNEGNLPKICQTINDPGLAQEPSIKSSDLLTSFFQTGCWAVMAGQSERLGKKIFLHFAKVRLYTYYWTLALGTWKQFSFKTNIAVVVALQMFIIVIIINLLSVAIKFLNWASISICSDAKLRNGRDFPTILKRGWERTN